MDLVKHEAWLRFKDRNPSIDKITFKNQDNSFVGQHRTVFSSKESDIDVLVALLKKEEVTASDLYPEGHEWHDKEWHDILKEWPSEYLKGMPKELFEAGYIPVPANQFDGGEPSRRKLGAAKQVPSSRKRAGKSRTRGKRRCKECRCKPCKCKDDIHCYKITGSTKPDKIRRTRRAVGRNQRNQMNQMNQRNQRNHMKTRRRKKTQKGGILPALCVPCWAGPVMAATGLGTAGYMVSRSSKSKTVNGRQISERKETYTIKKNNKQIKKVYEQKNNRIYLNGNELKPRPKNMKEATKRLNQRIRDCVKSGFKKC